ncbi:hypothetical protein [Bordetella genomosp. 4]|uniref:Uncharacterized protein n=1 Tax=Bordetella genomosp. 4 TaxID=463044 RepID=A0A261UTD3_9BORD|nr:hypothetical protein [Bordetella genomosp. 4]OZI64592.1 hypothetical protein CAL20_02750 [Bordetella genomosp. 4]
MNGSNEAVHGESGQQSAEFAADTQAVQLIKMKDLRSAELNAELLTQIAEGLRSIQPQMNEFLDNFSKAVQGARQWWRSNGPQIKAAIEWLISIDWPAVLSAIPETFRRAMVRAAAHGWFVGWNDTAQEVFDLTAKINSAADADIDEVLATHYRARVHAYGAELCAAYPHRAKPINAAVSVHRSPDSDGFFLSVPVFLAQADGVLHEITGCESPMSKVGKAGAKRIKAAPFLESNADDSMIAFGALEPILDIIHSRLLMSSSERSETQRMTGTSFSFLNRHQVMHGESSDYGSEVNSLKAFTLLTFIGLHLPLAMKHK